MQCPNCGEEMSDELTFCEKCGSPLSPAESPVEPKAEETAAEGKPPVPEDATAPVPTPAHNSAPNTSAPTQATAPANATLEKLKSAEPSALYNKIGMACGAVMVVAGLIVIFGVNSHVDTTIKFGADFYTESYQATALAVDAIVTLTKVCGGILAGLGAFTACYFGRK